MSKQSSGVNGFICHVWFEGGGESSSFWDDLKTEGGAIRRALRLWPKSGWSLFLLQDGVRFPIRRTESGVFCTECLTAAISGSVYCHFCGWKHGALVRTGCRPAYQSQ